MSDKMFEKNYFTVSLPLDVLDTWKELSSNCLHTYNCSTDDEQQELKISILKSGSTLRLNFYKDDVVKVNLLNLTSSEDVKDVIGVESDSTAVNCYNSEGGEGEGEAKKEPDDDKANSHHRTRSKTKSKVTKTRNKSTAHKRARSKQSSSSTAATATIPDFRPAAAPPSKRKRVTTPSAGAPSPPSDDDRSLVLAKHSHNTRRQSTIKKEIIDAEVGNYYDDDDDCDRGYGRHGIQDKDYQTKDATLGRRQLDFIFDDINDEEEDDDDKPIKSCSLIIDTTENRISPSPPLPQSPTTPPASPPASSPTSSPDSPSLAETIRRQRCEMPMESQQDDHDYIGQSSRVVFAASTAAAAVITHATSATTTAIATTTTAKDKSITFSVIKSTAPDGSIHYEEEEDEEDEYEEPEEDGEEGEDDYEGDDRDDAAINDDIEGDGDDMADLNPPYEIDEQGHRILSREVEPMHSVDGVLTEHGHHIYRCRFCYSVLHMKRMFKNHILYKHRLSILDYMNGEPDNSRPKSKSSIEKYKHKCPLCPQEYVSIPALLYHARKLHYKVTDLEDLLKPFIDKKDFKKPTRNKSKGYTKIITQCVICDHQIVGRNVIQHMKHEHMDIENFESVCTVMMTDYYKKRYQLRKMWIQDEELEDSHKIVPCQYCGTEIRKLNMYQHLRHSCKDNPNTPKMIKCNLCSYKSTSTETINKHVVTYHPTFDTETGLVIKISCSDCSRYFNTQIALKKHIYVEHRDPEKDLAMVHTCDRCPQSFKSKLLLENHYYMHERKDSMPEFILCPTCTQQFRSKKSMQKHRAYQHGSEFPFQCGKCKFGAISEKPIASHICRKRIVARTEAIANSMYCGIHTLDENGLPTPEDPNSPPGIHPMYATHGDLQHHQNIVVMEEDLDEHTFVIQGEVVSADEAASILPGYTIAPAVHRGVASTGGQVIVTDMSGHPTATGGGLEQQYTMCVHPDETIVIESATYDPQQQRQQQRGVVVAAQSTSQPEQHYLIANADVKHMEIQQQQNTHQNSHQNIIQYIIE